MILYPPIPSPLSSVRAPPPFVPLVRSVQPPFFFSAVLACGTLFFLSCFYMTDPPPPLLRCALIVHSRIPFLFDQTHCRATRFFTAPHYMSILPVLYIQCFPLPAAQPPSRSLPPSDITIHILSGRICGSLSCLFSALTGALLSLSSLFIYIFYLFSMYIEQMDGCCCFDYKRTMFSRPL